jgi:Ca2+-binding EF-hand superfamily protein
MKRNGFLLAAAAAILLTSCGGHGSWFGGDDDNDFRGRGGPRGIHGDPTGTAAGIKQLLRYDANKDGTLTRAEMEAGLKAYFAALDKDHSGTLTAAEASAENERRYKEDSTQYSPLLDWNQDGAIDFNEFANTARSLFDQLDRDHDGELSPSELKTPHGLTLEEQKKPAQGPRGNGGGY